MGIREDLLDGRVALELWGEVVATDQKSLPFKLIDSSGSDVEPVCRFLRDIALSGRSPLTVRSYAMDLLRWWRLLRMLGVCSDRVSTDEVAVLLGWFRGAENPRESSNEPATTATGSNNPTTSEHSTMDHR